MVKYWGYNTTKVRILQVAILKNFVNLSNGIKKSIIKNWYGDYIYRPWIVSLWKGTWHLWKVHWLVQNPKIRTLALAVTCH